MGPGFLIIAFVIYGVARLMKELSRNSGSSTPPPRTGYPSRESDAERIRRFREAVGLPVDPPPPVQPRQPPVSPQPMPTVQFPAPVVVPGRARRVPSAPGGPPFARTMPPVQARPVQAAQPAPPPLAPVPPKPAPAPAMAAPPSPFDPKPPAPNLQTAPVDVLLARLRDPSAIRQAIIFREILGPPRAFQSLWQSVGGESASALAASPR
jgi:hypothetical protein